MPRLLLRSLSPRMPLYIIGLLMLTSCWRRGSTEQVQTFGPLTVGQSAPSFTAVTNGGETFNSPPPPGRFTVYCIQDSLPLFCLDDGCGDLGIYARSRDGRVVGMSDGKGAAVFGVKQQQGRPPRFTTSLVVICDPNQRIVGICKGATPHDLDRLVRAQGF
jgi:hypothetical protein